MTSQTETPVSSTEGSSQSAADSERVLSVKSSLSGIGWKKEYHDVLRHLVNTVHTTTFHAYSLSKYIFLSEFEGNASFEFKKYVHKDFFKEVWLSLLNRKTKSQIKGRTAELRELISGHWDGYYTATGYQKPDFVKADQSATYEANRIYVAYTNNIKLHFADHLRRAINKYFKVKKKIKDMRKELSEQGVDDTVLREKISKEITTPVRRFKAAIAKQGVSRATFEKEPELAEAFDVFEPVLKAYPDNYEFEKDHIYYDCKANPAMHFKAFYKLALLFEALGLKAFECFPMRRSFSPCYIHIDTVILCQNILGNCKCRREEDKKREEAKKAGEKMKKKTEEELKAWKHRHWSQVVNLKAKPLRNQKDGELEFFGSIDTDGVGVTVIKKGIEKVNEKVNENIAEKITKKITKRRGAKSAAEEPAKKSIEYITDLSEEDRNNLKGKCVAVDPGRRDLLFCVHEDSTSEKPIKYRYTKLHQDKMRKMKKYRKIIQNCKKGNQAVQQAEVALSRTQGSAVSLADYEKYLKCRSQHSDILTNFYRETLTTPITRPATDPITDPIANSAAEPSTEPTTRPTPQPLFRKLKLSAYINKQQSDHKLIQELTEKFGKEAVFVMGNWSAPHAKHHGPIRGVGFRRLIQQHFKVFLIDEHKTSKCCPECNNPSLETFKKVRNPRLKKHEDGPKVIRHGLLRCTHQNCQEAMKNIKDKKVQEGMMDVDDEKDEEVELDKDNKPIERFEYRVWNRDMAACLNFIQIIHSVRDGKGVPTQFQRGAVPSKRSSNDEQGQRGSKQQKTIHP
ncbi:hypothetical protein BDF22DRAFT_775088 [Syncephalis plumigaleata]|nr:hypothetical protein BDF22DRAFT_775088 [Syncephalis plumigaleata]